MIETDRIIRLIEALINEGRGGGGKSEGMETPTL